MHLTNMLKRAMTIAGRDIATIDGERRWTWNECGDRVARLAGAVRNELDLAEGDRAAILALNSDRYFEFSHAMPWVGVVYVPINTRLAPPEIEYWLSDSGSRVPFVDDAFAEVALTLRGALAALEHLVRIGDGPTPIGMLHHDRLIEGAAPAADLVKGYDDLAAIYYTGGTTGVMLSHRNLVANTLHAVPACRLVEGIRYLHAAAMFHPTCYTSIMAPLPCWKRGVEERRGGLGPMGITPFPLPAHQTGRADFPHPASRPASPQSTRRWAKMDPTSSDHTELPERDRIGETLGASRRHLVAGSAFALT